jgi:hypothetical protein
MAWRATFKALVSPSSFAELLYKLGKARMGTRQLSWPFTVRVAASPGCGVGFMLGRVNLYGLWGSLGI